MTCLNSILRILSKQYLQQRKLLILLLFVLTTVSTTGQIKVRPREGDGISTLLARYGVNTKQGHRVFIRTNKKQLTANGGLILGHTYRIPTPKEAGLSSDPTSKKESKRQTRQNNKEADRGKSTPSKRNRTVKEPLLGKNFEQVTVKSNKLDGASFYLVSGHGGPDPGAIGHVGKRELHEDEYAYDIILRLGRCLIEQGAKVHFIIQDAKDGIRDEKYLKGSKRETCMGTPIPLNQTNRLQQRCDAVNRLYRKDGKGYRRAIFIHVDSRSRKDRVDVFFYHCTGSRLGQRLAEQIRRTFAAKYDTHQPGRGFDGNVSARDLYVLRRTNPPAVFLELGNIQNAKDRQRLVLRNNRQALAEWICSGIIRDHETSK